MRLSLVLTLGACLIASAAAAQAPPAVFPVDVASLPEEPWTLGPPSEYWFRAEYLNWWLSDTRVPFPVATTGNPADGPLAGTIGQPATKVLFGQTDLFHDKVPGMRLLFGGWLDAARNLGFETSGFGLARQSKSFHKSTDAAGDPPLYLSRFNVVLNREDSAILGESANGFAGSVRIGTDLKLWGMEANALAVLWRAPQCDVTFLAGLRYLNLQDLFELNAFSRDLVLNQYIRFQDRFEAENDFFGPQLGLRGRLLLDRWTIESTWKLAFGVASEVVNIRGAGVRAGPDAASPGAFPGGFLAQTTNIGSHSHSQFSFVPSLDLRVGYRFTERLQAFFGYEYLSITQIVRATDQVDRNLNLTQSPLFGTGTLAGSANPAPIIRRTDFYAHGLHVGLVFRF